ncbi:MAG: hypothetical protein Q7R78_00790 [bacterium]|nr:hypothetical protein [bacterium]
MKNDTFAKILGILTGIFALGWILGDIICIHQYPMGGGEFATEDGSIAVTRWIVGVGLPVMIFVFGCGLGYITGWILVGIKETIFWFAKKWVDSRYGSKHDQQKARGC